MNGHTQVLLAGVLAGTSTIFVKYLSLNPAVMTGIRTGLPLLFLIPFLAYRKQLVRGTPLIWGASALNMVRMYLFVWGVTMTSVVQAVVVVYTWPIFVALIELLLGEKITKWKTLALLTAFIGVLLMYANQEFTWENGAIVGMSILLVHSIIYAITFMMFKKAEEYTPWQMIFFQNLAGAIIFLPFIFFAFPGLGAFSVASVWAILAGLIVFGLIFTALKKLPASTVGGVAYIEVVSATFLGFLLLGERPELVTWIGGALIMAAVVVLRITSSDESRQS